VNIGRLEDHARDALHVLQCLLEPSAQRPKVTVLRDLYMRNEQPFAIDGYPGGGPSERVGGGDGSSDAVLAVVMSRRQDMCDHCTGCRLCGQIARHTAHKCEWCSKYVYQGGDCAHKVECGFEADATGGSVTLPATADRPARTITCKRCGGSGRRWADPVADSVVELLGRLEDVLGDSRRDLRRVGFLTSEILRLAKPLRESSLQGNCYVCHKIVPGTPNNRLKNLMCNACYLAWIEWRKVNDHGDTGDPMFDLTHRFTPERLAYLAAKSKGLDAPDGPWEDADVQVDKMRNGKNLPPAKVVAG